MKSTSVSRIEILGTSGDLVTVALRVGDDGVYVLTASPSRVSEFSEQRFISASMALAAFESVVVRLLAHRRLGEL